MREREIQREIDGSDVTIVVLNLAMSLHFPLPKIRKIGDEFTLSLAENSHFSFLPLHFPSLPSSMVTIVALKFAMCSHTPLPKNFALFPIFSSHRKNESNLYQKLVEIEKEIVREVARGDKLYLRKSNDRKAQISPLN